MTIKDRIVKFAEHMKINGRQFEISIGASNGWYGKNSDTIKGELLTNIVNVYPQMNLNWLITGKGSMVIAQTKTPPPAKANEGVNLAMDSEYVISLLENLKSGQEFIYSSLDKVRSHLELNAKPSADKRTLDDAAKQVAIERERIAAGGGKRNKVSSSAKSVQDNKE